MNMLRMAQIIEYYMMIALSIVIVALAVWALVDCLRHGADRFAQEGKRTKGFWLGLTVASTAVALLGIFSQGGIGFLQLIGACIACVYLADVKPAVSGKGGGWYNY
ncbi:MULTISPECIES: DUF2516 family protein [Micrococcaceae]|uniref:DUF2516 family protein n=2 Tax=Micrococcales TaxID=85006 RepID=UPI000CFD092A|nr:MULTISPECIES: DUF2516 family protein [unclassified Arthrobacter]MCS3493632.1 hypothetical protein [Arthrobacter sp. JUb119]PQZ85082.1 hypothetical protein CQ016_14595 [Arthrobacter sp. MYb222]PRB74755.1 hypothetical protein CQ012_14030 [Arthrobacter sp. MYb214]TDU19029.1 uncharacterized protein DUF2516 [Arthrobacter sp. JUb115]